MTQPQIDLDVAIEFARNKVRVVRVGDFFFQVFVWLMAALIALNLLSGWTLTTAPIWWYAVSAIAIFGASVFLHATHQIVRGDRDRRLLVGAARAVEMRHKLDS